MPDPTTIFELIGLRPIVADWLRDDAMILRRHGVILIHPRVSRAAAADWALSQSVSHWAQSEGPHQETR